LIDVRKPQIAAAGATIRSEGATALWRALETSTSTNATQAIAELGNTLQIFANLGTHHTFFKQFDDCTFLTCYAFAQASCLKL
jgi:hypothetical protein